MFRNLKVRSIATKTVALLFTGFIKAPGDGDYKFYLSTDTGALMRLHEATLIDEDFGYARGAEKSATIKLQAGFHPLRLYYVRRNPRENPP